MTGINVTDTPIHAGSIVAAVDGSPHSDAALDWAAEEARLSGRPLTLVYAERRMGAQERGWLAQAGIPLSQLRQEIRADSEKLLQRARSAAIAVAGDMETDAVLRAGDPRELLLELAGDASMIVLGSRGHGPVSSLLLGSVSVAVSRHATCPVVVVRPREEAARLRGVLVGTDGTDHSTTTLETAFREASFRAVPLTVVHCHWEAVPPPAGWRSAHPDDPFYDDARVRLAELLGGLREKFPDVRVGLELFAGHVDHCIADLSRRHALTVIGRHEQTLLERVGSFSLTTAVLEHASGPIIVVP